MTGYLQALMMQEIKGGIGDVLRPQRGRGGGAQIQGRPWVAELQITRKESQQQKQAQ